MLHTRFQSSFLYSLVASCKKIADFYRKINVLEDCVRHHLIIDSTVFYRFFDITFHSALLILLFKYSTVTSSYYVCMYILGKKYMRHKTPCVNSIGLLTALHVFSLYCTNRKNFIQKIWSSDGEFSIIQFLKNAHVEGLEIPDSTDDICDL